MAIVEPQTKLTELEFVAFDVETTGLSPVVARLVELSAVKFRLGDEKVESFSSLINPGVEILPEVTAIHGITNAMVADAPTFNTVIPEFVDFLGHAKTVLAAHNAPFDVGFMQVAMAKLQLTVPANFVLDTLPLCRRLLPSAPDHKLKTIVEHLSLKPGDFHRALADSYHVKDVIVSLAGDCETEISTWADLQDLGCVFRLDDPAGSGYRAEPTQEVRASIQSIDEAIKGGLLLSLKYNGYRMTSRVVRPIAVIQSRGAFYLNAFCEHAQDERTFRVDKITSLKVLVTETE